jgi:diguanylate cyclase (GGDEF)-like protein
MLTELHSTVTSAAGSAISSVSALASRFQDAILKPLSAAAIRRLGAGLIALTAAILLLTFLAFRADALREAEQTASGLASLLAEQTTRAVQSVDIIVRDLHDRIMDMGIDTAGEFASTLSTEEIHKLLQERLARLPQAAALSVFASDGRLITSTRGWPARDFNIGEMDYFKHIRDYNGSRLFISAPMESRYNGVPSLYFARRINAPDGTFLGLVHAAVSVKYFTDLYNLVLRSDGLSLMLARNDGTALVTEPVTASPPKIPSGSPWYRLASSGGGYFRMPADHEHNARTVAVQPLSDYPLVVSVGTDEAKLVSRWDQQALLVGLGLLSVVLYSIFLLRSLRSKSRELEVTLNNMTQGIIMVDGDRQVPVINRQAVSLLGLPDQFLSRPVGFDDILHFQHAQSEFGKDGAAVPEDIWQRIQSGGVSKDHSVYERVRPNGTALEIRSVPLPDGGVVRTYTDITERKRAEAEVRRMACRDELTGLANRVRLHEHLDAAAQRLRRHGQHYAIFYLDLDRFKAINDTLGLPAGDVLLKQVASRLLDCSHEADLVARIGGDEFVIVTGEVDHPMTAIPMMHRLLSAIGVPYDINGQRVVASASIGLAVATPDCMAPDEVLKRADLALQRAKSDGRGMYCFFEPELQEVADKRTRLEIELRQALKREEFEVHYLPWINCQSGRIAGCEALARWRHPTLGLIGPSDFIPVAEECGLIAPIGEWVLRRAAKEARSWPEHVKLSVNVSAAQFLGNNLSSVVMDAMADADLAPHRLELEVTESLLLLERGDHRATLQQLRRHGVQMALDDFGTGYASYRYLDLFPFNRIKIDRSFVSNIAKRPHCAAIVASAISLGQSLDIQTTAEGVESQEQLAFLRANGCNDAQGYLFGHPRHGRDMLPIIESQRELITAA